MCSAAFSASQLASKLTPEMEAAEAATVADAEAAQAAREGGARSGTGDAGSLAALSAMRYEQVWPAHVWNCAPCMQMLLAGATHCLQNLLKA
eukprot:366507-Chlamydomonas_euryale.AAC.9